MYALGKVEIFYEKLESQKRIINSYDKESRDNIHRHFAELADETLKTYEDKLAKELINIYPELRDYIRELELLAYNGMDADVVRLKESNKLLLLEVETLTKRIEKLSKKKPTTKKAK